MATASAAISHVWVPFITFIGASAPTPDSSARVELPAMTMPPRLSLGPLAVAEPDGNPTAAAAATTTAMYLACTDFISCSPFRWPRANVARLWRLVIREGTAIDVLHSRSKTRRPRHGVIVLLTTTRPEAIQMTMPPLPPDGPGVSGFEPDPTLGQWE